MALNPDTDMPAHSKRVLELAKSDPQLRELIPDPEVQAALRQPGLSYQEVIATALDGYASRRSVAERAYEVELDQETGRRRRKYLPRFDPITCSEFHTRIKRLATTWRHHPHHRVDPGDFVCILGFAGTDYATVDLACAYAQAVSVPLQTSLATADLDGIFIDTAPTAVAATVDDLQQAARFARAHDSVRSVIALDYDDRVDADREQYAAAQAELAHTGSRTSLATIDELISVSESTPWEPLPAHEAGEERMALIIHSSGSTGTPKGAIIPERIAKSQWDPGTLPVPVVRIVFAPMNHLGGRAALHTTIARGGTIHYTASSDLSTLFEDIRLARPTELMFFPRVMEMIHRHFLSEFLRRTAGRQVDSEAVKAELMAEMRRSFLGDRLCSIGVSTAPAAPEVKQFVSDCFGLPVYDGYGATEVGPVSYRDRLVRPPVTDYKVADVPELGYFTTDKPYSRGELCLKTALSIPGYFKNPEATARLFDEDGFVRTGDIVEERGPDHVVLIDRRNDVLKLSQGEFVALGALGTTFENESDAIHQIYLYGDSARSYLLAVVVPNMDVIESLLGPAAGETTIKDLIRSELRDVAAAANLKSFEIPRDFIIETEPFSHENGLLSSVYKRLRPALQARYGEGLEQMYADLERKQNEELMALQTMRSGLTVLEKVGKALEASLGVTDIDVNQPYGFVDLGGDSLGATAFSALLEDIFGITLPVSTILSPAGNPRQWAAAIERLLARRESPMPTFDKVHGKGAREIRAADLDVEAFINDDSVQPVPIEANPDVARQVLLTGATGFLGRFMCLEWLERLAAGGGRLICLVRATDREAGRRRLASVFEGADPALERRFSELAADHLEVVVGDVAEPRIGLTNADFDRLAGEVDRIVHPGALVNHVLDYEYLFGPNVAGTAELIRLALTHRRKPFDFVSSAATTYLLDGSGDNSEDTPLRAKVPLTSKYANGYGASKWAAEQLLHSAHRRFGLPVNVFRGDMMLAHSRYQQQINVPDIFTRLLCSVILTGLAPESFYRLEPGGSRPMAHYDGLAVDFIAAAIVGIAAQPHGEIRTFNVLNPHQRRRDLTRHVRRLDPGGGLRSGAGTRLRRVAESLRGKATGAT